MLHLLLSQPHTYIQKEEFGDTKGVIRIRKSKDRQQNYKMKRDKRAKNYLQNIIQKTNDRATRTILQTRVNASALVEGQTVPTPLAEPVMLLNY